MTVWFSLAVPAALAVVETKTTAVLVRYLSDWRMAVTRCAVLVHPETKNGNKYHEARECRNAATRDC
jgi:hypothetical protein